MVITRHNEPVAQLGPARPDRLHRGARVGLGRIQPALKRGTKGRYLAVLLEDRGAKSAPFKAKIDGSGLVGC